MILFSPFFLCHYLCKYINCTDFQQPFDRVSKAMSSDITRKLVSLVGMTIKQSRLTVHLQEGITEEVMIKRGVSQGVRRVSETLFSFSGGCNHNMWNRRDESKESGENYGL